MGEYDRATASALATIRRKGGPIRIYRPGDELPTDPAMPWKGSGEAAPAVTHVGVRVPLGSILGAQARPFAESFLIPGAGLSFELTTEMFIQDASDTFWKFENIQMIRPDAVSVILYITEVSLWAGA